MSPDLDVLIVDDAPTMRRILRSLLRELGLKKVREAEDGRAALEELKARKADLVISDWNMPRMNGMELLRAIRKDESLRHIPVLMIAAESKKENVIEAVRAGVNHYIVKPFNAQTLGKKLGQIFPDP